MKCKFDVTGMSCAACQAHVEKAVNALDGVRTAAVNLLATKIIVPHQLIVRESCCPPPENRTAALPGGAL